MAHLHTLPPPTPHLSGAPAASWLPGSKQQVESGNPQHFLHSSLCPLRKEARLAGAFKLLGTEMSPFHGSFPACEALVQSAIISIPLLSAKQAPPPQEVIKCVILCKIKARIHICSL